MVMSIVLVVKMKRSWYILGIEKSELDDGSKERGIQNDDNNSENIYAHNSMRIGTIIKYIYIWENRYSKVKSFA